MMNEYRIKVLAEQKKEGVLVARDGRLIVSVRAKRVEGRANAHAVALLAAHFAVPLSRVTIVLGHAHPTKTIRVRT